MQGQTPSVTNGDNISKHLFKYEQLLNIDCVGVQGTAVERNSVSNVLAFFLFVLFLWGNGMRKRLK